MTLIDKAELERLRAENAALKRDLQYSRDGLTKGRTRMREDNERLRKVWEDTRTQRDELLAHIAGKAPLPQWAADWLKA